MTGLLDPEVHQSLLTSYTGEYYTANPPTVEETRSKCHRYLTLRRINGSHRAPQKNTATNHATPGAWVNPPSTSMNQKPSSNQNNVNQTQASVQSGSTEFSQSHSKAPIDRSNWTCYACGALGHISRDFKAYRKTLCKMGFGPPKELTDPDEIDKHFAAAIKLAPCNVSTVSVKAT